MAALPDATIFDSATLCVAFAAAFARACSMRLLQLDKDVGSSAIAPEAHYTTTLVMMRRHAVRTTTHSMIPLRICRR